MEPIPRNAQAIILELKHVSVEFERKVVLDNISWKVKSGENWAIIGPNGAGKTTLLKLLTGYQRKTSGEISILGRSLGAVDVRDLRREIGLVSSYLSDSFSKEEVVVRLVLSGKFGTIGLWDRTSREDLVLAISLLKKMGCADLQNETFGSLSQGEKQRVIIARALMSRPQLLILDEVCAGLDLRAREELLTYLSKIARKMTLIFVTHRIEEIPRGFTHALLLREGEIVAQGKINAVMNKKYLEECFDLSLKIEKWHGRYYAIVARS